jgi:hypothetical protein
VRLIAEECEAKSGRASRTPGAPEKEQYKEDEAMTDRETSRLKAVAARSNYLAMDRADLQLAAEDLGRRVAAPTIGDWERGLGRQIAI